MTEPGTVGDLVVLVADRNAEAALRGLLGRTQSLRIRSIRYRAYVHPNRDPGCLLQAGEVLRPLQKQFSYALVVFDRCGSGGEEKQRADLERDVELRLGASGWAGRAAAICIDPELEVWVWTSSNEVANALGWGPRWNELRDWLIKEGLWDTRSPKPADPKVAMEAALRKAGVPRSSSIYQHLAGQVSLASCTDPSFRKLREVLRQWFPAMPDQRGAGG